MSTPRLTFVDISSACLGAEIGAASVFASSGTLCGVRRQHPWSEVIRSVASVALALIVPNPRLHVQRTRISEIAELVTIAGRAFVLVSTPRPDGAPAIFVIQPAELALAGGVDGTFEIEVREPVTAGEWLQ